MRVLVTGHAGLIGSEAAEYFYNQGHDVYGFDNNMRKFFFGNDGDTTWSLKKLEDRCPKIKSYNVDIRDRRLVDVWFQQIKPQAIIHCAAQPSHDLAAKMPFEDWDVNANGTFNLLEAARRHCAEAPFIYMSTNKVYGDAPNRIPLVELEKRWEYNRSLIDPDHIIDSGWSEKGVSEYFTIDQSKHSLFGASKLAADVACQEYGRYFNMPVGVFRGGCLTGARHSGAELHGYLSYFFKAAKEGRRYTIFGYKGKQVRDQIHSYDVVRAFEEFILNPKPGEVYNLGGGKDNSVSILESIDRVQQLGFKLDYTYDPVNRIGDHICYYSDLTKMKRDFPNWSITRSLDSIFDEFAAACKV
jgi:CDP-paratose 2-epimerase